MRRVSWNIVTLALRELGHESRLAWGVWVEIIAVRLLRIYRHSHASHEACELKFCVSLSVCSRLSSRLAWGVWVEMSDRYSAVKRPCVTPRMRRVSWNILKQANPAALEIVTPRMRRVSWNQKANCTAKIYFVTPRMRRVSWNMKYFHFWFYTGSHASHEACELKF